MRDFLISQEWLGMFLAIPISTIAFEFAFSTSGRVLGAFRSPITPKIVEGLVCAQDWMRHPNQPVSVKEILDEVDTLEKGYLLFI